MGERLARFEVEKRRALEAEDYETAMRAKQQMDEYRWQVYREVQLEQLLDAVGVCSRPSSLHPSPFTHILSVSPFALSFYFPRLRRPSPWVARKYDFYISVFMPWSEYFFRLFCQFPGPLLFGTSRITNILEAKNEQYSTQLL